MDRIPEPELMEDAEQGLAYARADFSEPNRQFLRLFAEKHPDFSGTGQVLDLGCGPADILIRFARRYPDCSCVGIDGARAMLAPGCRAVAAQGLEDRIALQLQRLPCDRNVGCYQVILSNSLLHHLHRPAVLWQTISDCTAPGGRILVMDLFRPPSQEAARCIVNTYAADEPEILQRDFYNSLLAAFRVDEVRGQLLRAGIDLRCEEVSDRHLAVWGTRHGW